MDEERRLKQGEFLYHLVNQEKIRLDTKYGMNSDVGVNHAIQSPSSEYGLNSNPRLIN